MDNFSHSWVIVYFSRPSSFLYVIAGFTLSNAHTNLFSLIYSGASPSNHLWQYHPNPLLGRGLTCLLINLIVHITLYILIHSHAWRCYMNFYTCVITLLSKYSFFRYHVSSWQVETRYRKRYFVAIFLQNCHDHHHKMNRLFVAVFQCILQGFETPTKLFMYLKKYISCGSFKLPQIMTNSFVIL